MNNTSHKRLFLAAALLAAALLAASAATPDFKTVLEAMDDLSDMGKQDFSSLVDLVTEKPGEKPTTTQVKIFRRDEHDQMVILIQKPEAQKGQGYLKIDDNVWFYDPESGNYSHSTMKENINNSEAKNSDFKKFSYSKDYEIEKAEAGKLGSFATWVLDLKANNNEVSYEKIKWSRDLKQDLQRGRYAEFSEARIRPCLYRRAG